MLRVAGPIMILTSSNRSFKKKFLLHDLRICLQSDSYCVNLRNNRAWEKWVVDTPLPHHATDVTAPSDMSALIINLFQFDRFRSKPRHDVYFVIASILLRLSWSFSSNERLLMSRRSDSFDGSVPSSFTSSSTFKQFYRKWKRRTQNTTVLSHNIA